MIADASAGTLFVGNSDAPLRLLDPHDEGQVILWKRLATGSMLASDLESIDYARVEPGARIAEHVQEHTEEIHVVLGGRGEVLADGTASTIAQGDVVLTPLGGRHGFRVVGDKPLEFLICEVYPTPAGTRRRGAVRRATRPITVERFDAAGEIAPGPVLHGPWSTIEYAALAAGDLRRYAEGGVEYFVYVVRGDGSAAVGARRVALDGGVGVTVSSPGGMLVEAGPGGLELFVLGVGLAGSGVAPRERVG